MSVVSALLAAINANPRDEASQLVIADYLQADGDPRGDLIVLDHAERNGLLDDPEALDQLLWLAAEYSFPRAEPEDPPLPFVQRSAEPYRYELVHGKLSYTLEPYNERTLYLYQLVVRPRYEATDADRRNYQMMFRIEGPWTTEQERVILAILSAAIRAETPLGELRFPYYNIPLPQYEGSPLRCYLLPFEYVLAHHIYRNRFGLAARDYHRWHAIWQRLRAMQRR